MGMYDYLQCDYPLPARAVAQTLIYQTKDFDSELDSYVILADGRLAQMKWAAPTEEISSKDEVATAQYENQAIPMPEFSGEIVFYCDYGDPNEMGHLPGWLEFKAYIQHGQVITIDLIEDVVPPIILSQERQEALTQIAHDTQHTLGISRTNAPGRKF